VKRMDRLFAILMALQLRQETAQSLAEKFEVSKRTILRDMQSLSEMGVPIYAVSGPSGGFRVMDGFKLAPLQLDTGEALTILFALRMVTELKETPFNRERWTVLDKIRKLVPDETVRQIEPMLGSMETAIPKRSYKTPHLTALLTHTAEARWLDIFYRSERHKRWLCIQPRRVVTANGFWYCEAYSETHGEERTFRVDRIDALEIAEPPSALAEGGQRMVSPSDGAEAGGRHKIAGTNKAAAPFREPVRVRVKLTYRGMLRVEQEEEHIAEQITAAGEEQWEVEFVPPLAEWDWFVRFFYSLGPEAEVVEPEAMREDILRIAEEMTVRYAAKKSDQPE